MIRPRGAVTRRRDDDQGKSDSSAEDVGRLLRDARVEHGLDLLAVHDRLSRPITQIEALENGDLSSLPDQAVALSTLRRYATLLGLDGDALAQRLSGAWPAQDATGVLRSAEETAVVRPPSRSATPVGPRGPADRSTTGLMPEIETSPDHLRAFTQTGEVPRFGVAPRPTTGNGAGPPTGTFPVVPHHDLRRGKRALTRARRRMRAPIWLRVATWTAVVLVLAVTAGWAIHTWNPQWLVKARILRVAQPGSGGSAPPSTTPAPVSHQKDAVQPVAANATSSAFVVRTAHFSVTVATTGRCWVQILSSTSSVPLVEGVQPAGKVFQFKATGTMTVQVGASPVLVGVAIGGRSVYLDKPSVTPFTYTFAPPGAT